MAKGKTGVVANKASMIQKLGAFIQDFERFVEIRELTEASRWARVRSGLLSPELRSVACFRFCHGSASLYRRKKLIGLVPFVIGKLWHRRLVATSHVHISPQAQVGAGLVIMHNYSMLIGPATIGTNCVMFHNITIGMGVAGNSQAIPTLGNNVWIGPGATIAGELSVGDNVTISAGTVLTRSVPSGALVAGNPGRVVQLEYNLAGRDPAAQSDDVV